MGYDMSWVEVPASEEAEVAAKREAFYAAARARDARAEVLGHDHPRVDFLQEKVTAALGELESAEHSYFRLNIWGMNRALALMAASAMVFDAEYGEFPEYGEYDEETEQYANQEEIDRFLAQHPGEFLGIPLFKLCSNDGWIVTPAECRAAVAQWLNNSQPLIESHGPDTELGEIIRAEWWPMWLEYLSQAAEHGGFRVR